MEVLADLTDACEDLVDGWVDGQVLGRLLVSLVDGETRSLDTERLRLSLGSLLRECLLVGDLLLLSEEDLLLLVECPDRGLLDLENLCLP